MKNSYLVVISIISFSMFFAGTIDLNSLYNYENQSIPNYINEDNTPNSNRITDEIATLGRVLFYDTKLSLSNTVSCASCHKQSLAFGDSAVQSIGHEGGLTARHSPRLANARFAEEEKFFWDERANSLETQSTMPIQDHIEMGFSGSNGNPNIDSLILRLEEIQYYDELFNFAFGDPVISENRIQDALAQFVRSMQSFDSKYDIGRALVGNENADFPNFTNEENNGKSLYMSNNATGCNSCHRAPEFDIDPNSNNNGVIGVAGSTGSVDLTNERSPSLRDIVNSNGNENGPYMHDGSLATLRDVIEHYDDIPNIPANNNLDNRLNGNGGNLNLTDTEKNELLAFLNTLGGVDIYTNEKWSNPFDDDGNLELLNGVLPVEWIYFDVYQQDENIILEWETLVEINNQGFELQHSRDSKEWEEVEFVQGYNESSVYNYVHEEAYVGDNYYRINQIDYDGKFEFSEIKFIKFERSNELVDIYPNPTFDHIYLKSSEKIEWINIYNSNGHLVDQLQGYSVDEIDLSDLVNGVYFIEAKGGSISSSMTKIIKM